MIASRKITPQTIFPASYISEAYDLERNGKPWHDKPDGEYLVLGHIPSATFVGQTSYKAIAPQMETLLPELADKAYQLTEDLRNYHHGTQKLLLRALKPSRGSSDLRNLAKEYEAARSMSNAFGSGQISLLLTLACLAFRKRNIPEKQWPDLSKDFTGKDVGT